MKHTLFAGIDGYSLPAIYATFLIAREIFSEAHSRRSVPYLTSLHWFLSSKPFFESGFDC